MVESDYLYAEGQGSQVGSIAYPIEVKNNQHQPFRYLGRKIPLAAWPKNDPKAEYLPLLTAVGYGEPTFAAFYPNCHSVFGFHDDEYAAENLDGLQYEVIGWYSEAQQDHLNDFVEKLRETIPQDEGTPPTNQELIEKEFKWKVNLEAGQKFPESLGFICYARLRFASLNTVKSDKQASVEVTVGNTGTEALSAYLGQKIDSNYKSIIEDQLEALHLASRLQHQPLDMTPKFKEARHDKGFNAIAAGTMWTIRLESVGSKTAKAEDAHNQAQITLPDDLAHLLNKLNLLQQDYDRAWHEIESMRRQLFADWYKYMLSSYPPEGSRDQYPDIDEVKHYIEVKGIAPLQAKLTATGNLMLSEDDSGKITAASAGESSSTSIASQLAVAINQLLEKITALNNQETVKNTQATYTLKQISSPRYWQPKEPVLLMTGEAVKASPRHGQDGRLRDDELLECEIIKDVTFPISKDSFSAIRAQINQLEGSKTGEHIAFSNWQEQPWHPFLLEWEVEVFPIREGCNHRTYNSNYDNKFITSNYGLKENEADLALQSGKGAILKAANVYSGRSILTPHAGIKLKEQLEAYLNKQILPKYYEAKKIPKEQQSDDYLSNSDHIEEIRDWYKPKKAKDPIYTAIRAYKELLNPDLNSLSQSLGGFNEALLMHTQTLQLPIADPLGFADYQPFTEAVRDVVLQSIRSAPEPLNDFNPIRSGAMKILRLRLVDTFGQVKELDVSNIITTEQMTTPDTPYLVTLPPRLVQPARLNFRWLSASQGEQEMNTHPATTPICGWILPNNLDNTLAIYDNQGKALGSINQLAEWESAPGQNIPIAVADIGNEHLRKLVNHILTISNSIADPPQPPLTRGESVSFLDNFISALDSGLENIDPENFAQHQGLALLMGRPIAVVRASLNLELQGFPSVNQDWNVFWQDLKRNSRDTDGFDQVKFPIRLGEYHQFNDGLVGYWQEEEDGLSEAFYAPQSDLERDTDHIKVHHPGNAWHIDLNLENTPKLLTMLIDPRGKVHATCGILPTKGIDIPPDQYQEALEKIEITFLSTPILTDMRDLSDPTLDKKINLPLPGEAGYQWSWLEKEQEGWLDVPHDTIGQANPNAVFSGQQAIREGWLKLSPADNQD
ncbi:hypothetical protein [Moorena sp. SIO4E2]|uniref:hypothetical protein n=1 Tax=Moorena sp. SIO4E2 TaxID=2607826 RepID=UPI00257CAFB6|nr:hypothetical protein [Moorena sp. SIO4E2]